MEDINFGDRDANICCLCKHTTHTNFRFFCGNPNQKDKELCNGTKYNDTCKLFELKEDFYDKYREELH